MDTPKKQYRGESRMDYLTRTEAEEDEYTPIEWGGLTWCALGGFAAVTLGWVALLAWWSWRALS